MAVTAALVKELRERTGLGMMECKKALVKTDGDIEQAIDNLRKSGQAKAAKKAGRTAAEGVIVVKVSDDAKTGIILEVNSETDFVARDDSFRSFVASVCQCAMENRETNVEKLKELALEDGTKVEEARLALIQKIGENIQVRRAVLCESPDGVVGAYVHGGRIGVLAVLQGGNPEVAKDVAMHVAAANPAVVNPDDVDEATLQREKEIFAAQARESGKPDEIVEKMIVGRINKFLKEISLVEQPFVKDPDLKVGELVKKAEGSVVGFTRFEVGEGIEKEEMDFASEVMAQVRGD